MYKQINPGEYCEMSFIDYFNDIVDELEMIDSNKNWKYILINHSNKKDLIGFYQNNISIEEAVKYYFNFYKGGLIKYAIQN